MVVGRGMGTNVTHEAAPYALAIPLGLVRLVPAGPPIVSVYVDWRVSGRGRHEAPTIIEKRLREVLAALPARGEAHASLSADAARIGTYLTEQVEPASRGVALFASHDRGLWFVQQFAVPVTTMAHVGDAPVLLPFAEVVQDAGQNLVAIVDTEHLRMIDMGYAGVRELEGLAEDTWGATRISSRTAWRTANRLRARDTALERFAEEVAGEIAAAAGGSAPRCLALAGGDEIVSLVRSRLPAPLRERVMSAGHVAMHTPEEDVIENVWPAMQAVAARMRGHEIERVLAHQECVARLEPVRSLLSARLVGLLALDPARIPSDDCESLLRPALDQHAEVIIARAEPQLTAVDGVVALPR